MKKNVPMCYKNVDAIKCICCSSKTVRNGKTSYGSQRYKCTACYKNFQASYQNKACYPNTSGQIADLVKEGCGIRSVARILKISATTVLKKIANIARTVSKPTMQMGREYELDELCTYIKKKTNLVWIVYAIRKDTKEVVDFAVGRRTLNTIKTVTNTLILSNASKVFTDKLPQYGSLLPRGIHWTNKFGTNHIERKNLTLRTHLKRLGRRTICCSKTIAMLTACLKLYFWIGHNPL